jgi:hypothetical protein
MSKTILNSSLVPEIINAPDNTPDTIAVVSIPIPDGIKYPQWVNGSWQEYDPANDPCVKH